MSGIMALGGSLDDWSADDLQDLAGYVARYKEIRAVVQFGARYCLAGPQPAGLAAVQYGGAGDGEIAVFAWLPTRRLGRDPRHLRLTALDPAARYRREYDGAVLTAHGLPLDLPAGDYASSLTILDLVTAHG